MNNTPIKKIDIYNQLLREINNSEAAFINHMSKDESIALANTLTDTIIELFKKKKTKKFNQNL